MTTANRWLLILVPVAVAFVLACLAAMRLPSGIDVPRFGSGVAAACGAIGIQPVQGVRGGPPADSVLREMPVGIKVRMWMQHRQDERRTVNVQLNPRLYETVQELQGEGFRAQCIGVVFDGRVVLAVVIGQESNAGQLTILFKRLSREPLLSGIAVKLLLI